MDDPDNPIEQTGPRRNRQRLAAVAAVPLLLLSACSARQPPASGPIVNITLRDFEIESSTPVVGQSDIVFRVLNRAPATHEFVVVRSDVPPDQLPIASDGLSVDEDRLRPVGEIGEIDTGTTEALAIHLAPGRYVFFCNLEGHYLGGMYGVVEVSGDARPS